MKHISADIHCHPTLKPYGKSFPQQVQNNSIQENTNLYYYDPQTFWDKVINRLTGLTEFRQSNYRKKLEEQTSFCHFSASLL